MRRPKGLLGRILIVAGVGHLMLGFSWLVTTTESRLQGVHWLAGPFTDTIIGVGWVAAGALAIVGGVLSRFRPLETAATVAVVVWPLAVAGVFTIAWIWGDAPNGWITAIAYLMMSSVVATAASDPRRITAPQQEEEIE